MAWLQQYLTKILYMTETAYLGLGSNLGDRKKYIQEALYRLGGQELAITCISSLYESAPLGAIKDQPLFFNIVVEVKTALKPMKLLRHCLSVEDQMGRVRKVDKGPRKIDIDLLLQDDRVVRCSDLVLPHPELTSRLFVLKPLLELNPTLYMIYCITSLSG